MKQDGGTPAKQDMPVVGLSTLKDLSVTELTKIAKQLDVPGATGMRKQELIFEILRSRPRRAGCSSAKAFSRRCPTASAFCVRPTTTTSRS